MAGDVTTRNVVTVTVDTSLPAMLRLCKTSGLGSKIGEKAVVGHGERRSVIGFYIHSVLPVVVSIFPLVNIGVAPCSNTRGTLVGTSDIISFVLASTTLTTAQRLNGGH